MVKYMKCPRCELNYIDSETQEYCDLCVKEMKGIEDDLFLIEDEDELVQLCPQCGENMMRAGEEICEFCRKKLEEDDEEEPEIDPESDEEWRTYLDDETEVADDLGLGAEFGAEFDDEKEEDEELYHEDDEDLEYVTIDEIDRYANASTDDEDDDDEDDDDDDF